MSDRVFSLQLRAHSQDCPLKIPVNKAASVVCPTPGLRFLLVHRLSISPTHLHYLLKGKENFFPHIFCINI